MHSPDDRANELMKSDHDRMPVILDLKDYGDWLDPDLKDPKALEGLLRIFPGEAMQAYPISTLVNSRWNDDPKCVEPV